MCSGSRAYRVTMLSSQTRTNTDFRGSVSTDIGPYTGLLPEVSPPSQSSLKSMQWQPRLIWRPHAIFFNYAIRRILLTVVLKPLETWKFHFPCIYSSSLSTYWFIFFSFLLLVENPSQRDPLLLYFSISQNLRFQHSVCDNVKACKCASVNSGIIAIALAAFLAKLRFLFSMFLNHWTFSKLKKVVSPIQNKISMMGSR